MRFKWRVALDKVIEYRLEKGMRLSPMDTMHIAWEFRVDYEVLAKLSLRVTNFGKFAKEIYG